MRELKVTPIRNGTVIDHLPMGSALAVCKVLGIPREGSASIISVVMNVPSHGQSRKDIVKVEDRELDDEDLGRLAILAPNVTVNVIHDYLVAKKVSPDLPEKVADIVACPNTACVTHGDEPVVDEYKVHAGEKGEQATLECVYCGRRVDDPLALLR